MLINPLAVEERFLQTTLSPEECQQRLGSYVADDSDLSWKERLASMAEGHYGPVTVTAAPGGFAVGQRGRGPDQMGLSKATVACRTGLEGTLVSVRFSHKKGLGYILGPVEPSPPKKALMVTRPLMLSILRVALFSSGLTLAGTLLAYAPASRAEPDLQLGGR